MKNRFLIALMLMSTIGLTQKQKDDLAIVKVKMVKKVCVKKIEPVMPLPILDMKTSIDKGFGSGNVNLFSVHFLPNLDVSLLDKESLYSKSQAEQVLKTFFTEHKPVSFAMIHEGKSTNVKYYIGTLKTINQKYRVTVNVKIVKGVEKISGLTIELAD